MFDKFGELNSYKEINELAKLVMAKIDMDKVGDLLGGLGSLLKK